jgi:hypothetical protein
MERLVLEIELRKTGFKKLINSSRKRSAMTCIYEAEHDDKPVWSKHIALQDEPLNWGQ